MELSDIAGISPGLIQRSSPGAFSAQALNTPLAFGCQSSTPFSCNGFARSDMYKGGWKGGPIPLVNRGMEGWTGTRKLDQHLSPFPRNGSPGPTCIQGSEL